MGNLIFVAWPNSLIHIYHSPSAHYNPIHHLSHLGPHRVSLPPTLSYTLGWAWNDALEDDATKKKIKIIISHIQ